MRRGFTLIEPSHAVAQSPRRRGSNKAFTLIELSIVLVIIGLIVGGVLVGQDLIKAATLRSQISEWEQFNASTQTFRLKYNCLPGDCEKASNFFTALTPVTCCPPFNGNGNGFISTNPIGGFTDEKDMYFQHLYLAGLSKQYKGLYFNTQLANETMAAFGDYIPTIKTKASNAVWWVSAADPGNLYTSNGPYIPKGYHYFFAGVMSYGELRSHIHEAPWGERGAFYPTEALQIDQKLDDGIPNTGRVLAIRAYNHPEYNLQIDRGSSYCLSSLSSYLSTATSTGCSLAIRANF